MDIQYLLWLQTFRNNIDDALTPVMEFVSMFATTYLILIPVLLLEPEQKGRSLCSGILLFLYALDSAYQADGLRIQTVDP